MTEPAKEKAVADRIEQHNQVVRLKAAREKLAQGRTLTGAEKAAVSAAEAEKNRRAGEPWVRRMPKKDFLELVGGSSRVFLKWEKEHGLPWGKDEPAVDAIAVLSWFRTQFAHPTAAAAPVTEEQRRRDEVADRLAELKLAKAEADHQRVMGRLVEIDQVESMLDACAASIRQGIERLSAFGDGAQQVMVDALEDFEGKRGNGKG